jgi:cytochrome c553
MLTGATILLSMLLSAPAFADAEAEQTAKNLCAGCHGPAGISTNPLWPNLAGQKAGYTAKQLRDYRDGIRVDPSMNGISQPLTDAQITKLAELYAKLPAAGE